MKVVILRRKGSFEKQRASSEQRDWKLTMPTTKAEDGLKTEPPCHPHACAIQECIQKNNYNEGKCQKQIDALYECCNLFYQKAGDEASTVSCPKAKLLRLKMKQRSQGVK